MTRVLLVRHAPAIRPKGLIYGAQDYQAEITACPERERLRSLVSARGTWVSSSLRRARETDCALAGDINYDKKIIVDSRFNEQDFGELEGTERPKGTVTPYWLFPRHIRPTGGESFDDLCRRVTAALYELVEQLDDNDELVIFTHGNAIRSVLSSVLDFPGDSPAKLSIGNWGVVSLFSGPDGFTVLL